MHVHVPVGRVYRVKWVNVINMQEPFKIDELLCRGSQDEQLYTIVDTENDTVYFPGERLLKRMFE